MYLGVEALEGALRGSRGAQEAGHMDTAAHATRGGNAYMTVDYNNRMNQKVAEKHMASVLSTEAERGFAVYKF